MTWPRPIAVFHPAGHRDWLRTGAVTNRGPGPGLALESGGEELWFCRKGWGRGGQATTVGGARGQPGAVGGLPALVRAEPPARE